MINAILEYSYMQNAFLAAIFSSVICAVIGTIIIEKRLVNMSGGIAHSSFGGIGLGYLLNFEPIIGGLVFAVLASLGVSKIKKATGANSSTIINIFWAFGMALGILFISLTPGYPPDMSSYFFGDILTVNRTYLLVMSILTFITLFIIFAIFNYWRLYLFDEEYAKILGININLLETLLYILIAFCIVILIKVVGVILAIAMLTIPPSISKLFSIKLKSTMILSGILGVFFTLCGLTLSYYLNIPSGATIIMVSILFYFISMLVKSRIKKDK